MADRAPSAVTGARPAFLADSCLRTLGTLSDCRLCIAECPVAAIAPGDRDVAVDDACIGCGRCTAVCPTEALRSGHNDIATLAAHASRVEPLSVECERVPKELRSPNTVSPPCLGALGINELLALQERAGAAPVEIVDRQWCNDCPAGGEAQPPGAAARERVARLLAEAGLARRAPILVARMAGKSRRDDGAPRHRSRRAFLRRFVPSAAAAPAPPARSKESRRKELLALLRRIGGAVLPASVFPEVRIGERCADNRLCASVCPTGALKTYADASIGVEYHAEHCIACGACVAICPERAVSLSPGGAHAPAGPIRLTTRRLRTCSRCDADFSARDDAQELCPNCRKDTELFG